MGRNMSGLFASDVNNTAYTRQLYPEAGGETVGTAASALSPYTKGAPSGGSPRNTLVDSGRGSLAPAGGGGGMAAKAGHPLTWWFVLAILLVALMWFAERFGSEKEAFKNLRLSAYNIIVITLAALVGFGVFKTVFGRFQVPGLSDYVAAV